MEERHEMLLLDLLETIVYEGYASIAKAKLAYWYGQLNFTVTIRRDLRERWRHLLVDTLGLEERTLRIADSNGTVLLMRDNIFFEDVE